MREEHSRKKEQKEQRTKDLGLPGPETLATVSRVLALVGGSSRAEIETWLWTPRP